MALFGTKKSKEMAAVAAPAAKAATAAPAGYAGTLLHARITEKATDRQADSVYTFDVAPDATKRDVAKAVRAIYGVTPRKVAVVTIRRKAMHNRRTGRIGFKPGGKKAYVYLKKGETITLS